MSINNLGFPYCSATAAANLDIFRVIVPRVVVETLAIIASATLAEALATFRVIALKAPTVLEAKMVMTKSTTDSRSNQCSRPFLTLHCLCG